MLSHLAAQRIQLHSASAGTGDFIAAKYKRPFSLIHPDVKKHVSVAFIAVVINMQER